MELYGILKKDVLEKLYSFCAYQERCQQDIIKKLNKLEIPNKFHQEYINHLQEERFFNEQRFANSFVRSKLLKNQWGKRKIEFSLRQKKVQQSTISEAIAQIKDKTYVEVAHTVAEKKIRSLSKYDAWQKKQKLYAYLAQKGFETYIIQEVLDGIK